MIDEFRKQVEAARRVWMEENPEEDGHDRVTPFDQFLYGPTPGTVADLQKQVHKFAEKTFGKGREDAAWKKLFEELGEVLKKPRDPSEWGDVFILLLDLATVYDIDVEAATLSKLEAIRVRVWRRTETGTFQHIPGRVADQQFEEVPAVFMGGGPHENFSAILVPVGEAPPSAFCPPGWQGPGGYELLRVDRGPDRRSHCVYIWRPDMGVPF